MYRFFGAKISEMLREQDVSVDEYANVMNGFNAIIVVDIALIVGSYSDSRQAKVETASAELEAKIEDSHELQREITMIGEQLAAPPKSRLRPQLWPPRWRSSPRTEPRAWERSISWSARRWPGWDRCGPK